MEPLLNGIKDRKLCPVTQNPDWPVAAKVKIGHRKRNQQTETGESYNHRATVQTCLCGGHDGCGNSPIKGKQYQANGHVLVSHCCRQEAQKERV